MHPRLFQLRRFHDHRGWFSEVYSRQHLGSLGIRDLFVQDNHSFSRKIGTLRGLHFQYPPHAQAKLVQCLTGAIWDVMVDIRAGSPTWGQWTAARLSGDDGEILYVPVGFAHGFVALTSDVHVLYKTSAYYMPESEGSVRWDDPSMGIRWPLLASELVISDKDRMAPGLDEVAPAFPYDGQPLTALREVAL